MHVLKVLMIPNLCERRTSDGKEKKYCKNSWSVALINWRYVFPHFSDIFIIWPTSTRVWIKAEVLLHFFQISQSPILNDHTLSLSPAHDSHDSLAIALFPFCFPLFFCYCFTVSDKTNAYDKKHKCPVRCEHWVWKYTQEKQATRGPTNKQKTKQ